MIGMVGLITDTKDITTQDFKEAGDLIYVIGETAADFNGTEIQKMQRGLIEGKLMDFDLATEKVNQDLVLKAIQTGLVTSAHDCAEGGLAVALAECTFKNGFGVAVDVKMPKENLFAETQSRFVLSVKKDAQTAFEKLAEDKATLIGKVTDDGELKIQALDDNITVATHTAKELWEDAIACLMK